MTGRYLLDTNAGAILFPVPIGGPGSTLTATADPTTANDSTQNIGVGAVWFNATAGQLRWWECRDNTAGNAKWVFSGADYSNGGTNPNTEATVFGGGTASIAAEGNINRQISSAGVVTGANGSDIVLATFNIPGGSFDGAAGTNRGLTITAQGSFGGNGNNKRIKILFNVTGNIAVGGSVGAGNGSLIADTGIVTTNGSGWSCQANVFKYGALNSNTQIGLHQQSQCGGSVTALVAPTLITATENAAIQVVVTGNTTTLTNDVVFNFLEVNALN